jgi:hypothetical protein
MPLNSHPTTEEIQAKAREIAERRSREDGSGRPPAAWVLGAVAEALGLVAVAEQEGTVLQQIEASLTHEQLTIGACLRYLADRGHLIAGVVESLPAEAAGNLAASLDVLRVEIMPESLADVAALVRRAGNCASVVLVAWSDLGEVGMVRATHPARSPYGPADVAAKALESALDLVNEGEATS